LKKNIIIFIFGAAFVIALDQITKAVIVTKFSIHESYAVINGFFNLVYVMNPGAPSDFWLMLLQYSAIFFFIGITSAVILLIIYYM